jgi:Rieske Fe-S protein
MTVGGTSRRAFCGTCCSLLACAAGAGLALQAEAPTAEAQPLKLLQETRAQLKPGMIRDYRKLGSFFLLADERGIYALTAICTHRGCTVSAEGDSGFGCPCHDSAYDRQGLVIEGPAKLPLKHFDVRESEPGGRLVVDLSKVVGTDVRL